jgi:hypothetical protein
MITINIWVLVLVGLFTIPVLSVVIYLFWLFLLGIKECIVMVDTIFRAFILTIKDDKDGDEK